MMTKKNSLTVVWSVQTLKKLARQEMHRSCSCTRYLLHLLPLQQLDSSVVSSNTEEVGEARDAGDAVDPNKTYAITSDDEMVTVYDNEGNVVFQATLTDWEENREAYYEKYRLGSS